MPASPTDRAVYAALDAMVTIDEDACIVEFNPAAEESFGYSRAEALGQPMAELLVPPRLRRSYRARLRRVLSDDAPVLGRRVEVTAMRAGGGEFPVEVRLTRTSDAPPRFTAWVRDLTERKIVEAESAHRKALLERAEELAAIGSWAWRVDTGELRGSNRFLRLVGLDPDEARSTLDLFLERAHPDDRERVRREMELAGRAGELNPIELRIVRPDGRVRHLRVSGGTSTRGHGPCGQQWLVGSVQDISEQRRAEREIAAHVAVLEALTSWDSLERGAGRLLRDLAEALDFPVATLWMPHGDVLGARAFWSAPYIDATNFERATHERGLPRGVGLAGQAWERGAPVDLATPAGNGCARREATPGDDFRGGVALPALTRDEVLAVIELRSPEEMELGDRLMRSLTFLGYELGAFLARRRGELKPPTLTARELEVLQLAAQGVSGPAIAEQLVVSPATVKTHFEHIYAKLGVSERAAAVAHALREGLIE